MIVDITAPRALMARWVKNLGAPFIHDVHVREGSMFPAEWNDGMAAYDIGGRDKSSSPTNPVLLGRVQTVGG